MILEDLMFSMQVFKPTMLVYEGFDFDQVIQYSQEVLVVLREFYLKVHLALLH